jgi:hypothetical protein
MKRGLFSIWLFLFAAYLAALDLAAQESFVYQFEAIESAGIRRRSDLVSTRISFQESVLSGTGFRLEYQGKPVACQFGPVIGENDRLRGITIDFIDHFQPWEKRRYSLLVGPGVASRKEVGEGLRIEESSGGFTIKNRDYLIWTVRKDLKGLFGFLRLPELTYVRADSPGLGFRSKDGQYHLLSEKEPSRVQILREGPIACALEFEYDNWPIGNSSTVVLEFPRTKSWVHVTWSIRGKNPPSEMGAKLSLVLEGEEKLVDFGGEDFVYNTVREEEVAFLKASSRLLPAWGVYHGSRTDPKPIVLASQDHRPSRLGGWVHLMDEKRCTALAVGDFGEAGDDYIEVDGAGLLQIIRKPEIEGAVLEFWVHFVDMPVHIGARTSPQSMKSPLEVRWLPTDQ